MLDVRRRDVIALLGAAVAWPLAARAQQPDRMRRIGILTTFAETDPESKAWLAAFEAGLQKLGWTSGRNVTVAYRWAAGDENRINRYAAELVTTAPDAIFVVSTQALVPLQRLTRSLPIVFVQVSDPVRLGLVASLARPGGNITGFVNFEHAIGGKWLEFLKDTMPGLTRVLVLFQANLTSQAPYVQAVQAAAPSFGVQATPAEFGNADEIERAVDSFAQQPNGALVVPPSTLAIVHRDLIIGLAARHRLPAVYPYRAFANGGGLISYGVDLADQYRRAASYVDTILRGANPGDLPVQLPTKFDLVVNLKTAKVLGLRIPEPFLQAADEVIE
jgi:ABC-type uncharacterized transport system substrate-binding protein